MRTRLYRWSPEAGGYYLDSARADDADNPDDPDLEQITIRPGDVIGFTKHNWVNWVIELATLSLPGWGVSHVGIVADHPRGMPGLVVYESLAVSHRACIIQGQVTSGVQCHWLHDTIADAGQVRVYRLADPLDAEEAAKLSNFAQRCIGLRYDTTGALSARDLLCGWLHRLIFAREDLERFFCSEFVAACHRYVGRFRTRNVSAWSPNRLIRTETRAGIILPPVTLSV